MTADFDVEAPAKKEVFGGVGLNGTSGHCRKKQFRFAYGGFAPLVAMLVVFFAKDMYILKFGANTTRVSCVAIVWSLAFPCMYPIVGYLMDREPPILAIKNWGRRAPWFAVHLIPLALTIGLIYLPGLFWQPETGSVFLDVWLAICLFAASWCLSVLLNSLESSRAEIYPFKDERTIVEAMSKPVGVMAATAGLAPQLALWASSSMAMRFAISIGLFMAILTSMEVVPILRDARQPRGAPSTHSWRELVEVLKSPVMRHATAIRFWHSAADTTSLNFSIYYATFVDACDSVQRAKWMLLSGVIVGTMELCFMAPFWGIIFTESTEETKPWKRRMREKLQPYFSSMQGVCFKFEILGAIIPVLLLRLLPYILPRPWEWVAYSVSLRAFFSPQAFYRSVSFCWAVDADCHASSTGRRREAQHAGLVRLFEEQGRTIAFALFLGLGAAGLQNANCELSCNAVADGLRDSCIETCDRDNIASQPEAVRDFITSILTYVVPLFVLLCAAHIYLFPIHGERLEELQRTQAITFKSVTDLPAEEGAMDARERCPTESTAANEINEDLTCSTTSGEVPSPDDVQSGIVKGTASETVATCTTPPSPNSPRSGVHPPAALTATPTSPGEASAYLTL